MGFFFVCFFCLGVVMFYIVFRCGCLVVCFVLEGFKDLGIYIFVHNFLKMVSIRSKSTTMQFLHGTCYVDVHIKELGFYS